jgi:23S rRNA (cytidine1920-2'-O)/16S rRNA (cytidine1409-2'-O)-methyltransferase
MARVRIDQLLVDRGLAPTRARAQALILAGEVSVGPTRVDKAGALVSEDAPVVVRSAAQPYVSRGGDLRCLDLGASTGGFTDCLLQRGAARVVAVDVGYGQLASKLRSDPRVIVMERTNARTLTPADIDGPAELITVDASFIGIAKLIPAIARCAGDSGTLLALVKPQFEVGRAQASRGKGVVRDDSLRAAAVAGAVEAIRDAGFEPLGQADSVLPGPKGNREVFVWARKKEQT